MKSMQAPNRAIHLIHCSEHFFKMWNVGLGVDILTENRVDHGDFIVRFSNLKNLKKNKHLSYATDHQRHAGSSFTIIHPSDKIRDFM